MTPSPREAIARIIEPKVFQFLDAHRRGEDTEHQWEQNWRLSLAKARDNALAKADQILALQGDAEARVAVAVKMLGELAAAPGIGTMWSELRGRWIDPREAAADALAAIQKPEPTREGGGK